MGVFQKIGNALARFMYGRNGVDQLSLVIVVGSLVLDLISMLVAPHLLWLGNALYLVSIAAWAFALFRLFDIWKPWPVHASETWLPAGWGIMLDDILAGLMAMCCMLVLRALGWV